MRTIYLNPKTYGMHYWVIRTQEKEPRFIEVILDGEYGLMYNIHFAKVWKSTNPPYNALERFEKRTGLQACIQEVPAEAYNRSKKYEEYFDEKRELTMQEKIQLKEEMDEWRIDHYPEKQDGAGTYEIN